MDPVVIAIFSGVAVYLLVIAVIPKRFVSDLSYTQSALRKLEDDSLASMSTDSFSLFRNQARKSNFLTRVFFTLPGSQAVYPRMLKAGLGDSIDKFFVITLSIFVILVYLFRGVGFWGALAALAITYIGAWYYVNRAVDKRNQAFIASFPDALDMIVRSVRSGYPLNTAIRMVADNMQAPVSTEFKQVVDETSYGSSIIESLQRLSFRIEEPDIRFFVVVLTVQQEVGGNLAEVLSNLASIIRKRKHLYMKVKALSSEGRATAWVLGLLPVFEFLAIYMVSPGHLTPLFTTYLGNMVLASAIAIVLLGVFIVRQMINIEV